MLKAKERVLAKALLEADAKHKSLYEKYLLMQEEIQNTPGRKAIPPALSQLADERDQAGEEIIRLKGELELEKGCQNCRRAAT